MFKVTSSSSVRKKSMEDVYMNESKVEATGSLQIKQILLQHFLKFSVYKFKKNCNNKPLDYLTRSTSYNF